nr:hypothetical protein [uncultured Holophaga sp.]
MADEMRVRLSADGIKEVIDSLKKVQSEVRKTGEEGKSAGDALGALGTLFAAKELAGFARNALVAADQLDKMSIKTGVAVENLSVFVAMGATADATLEDIQGGFNKLAKSLDALQSGDATATDYFKRIGLSAKDLKGLSLDQAMVKIAEAMGGFKDGAGKAAVAMGIFGKSGAGLLPLLNDLANGGFKNAKAKITDLGQVISGDTARKAAEFNDSMVSMGKTMEAALAQTAADLVPALTNRFGGLSEVIAQVPGPVKTAALSFGLLGSASTATVAALRVVGPAIMTTLTSPVGIAVVAISALVAGFLAWQAAMEKARQEALKDADATRSKVEQGNALVAQYEAEAKALADGNISKKERSQHEIKLKEIREKLLALDPAYQASLEAEKNGLLAGAAAVRAKVNADKAELDIKREKAKASLAEAAAQLSLIEATQGQPQLALGVAAEPDVALATADTDLKKARLVLSQAQELVNRYEGITPSSQETTPKKDLGGGENAAGKSAADALAKARLEAQTAAAKREAELQAAALKSYTETTEAWYKSGLIDLQTYLAARKTAIVQANQVELASLDQQIAATSKASAAEKDPAKKLSDETKLADLKNQRLLKEKEGVEQLTALEREALTLREQAATESLKLAAELEEAEGTTGQATLRMLESEYDARIKTASVNDKLTLQELKRLAVLKQQVQAIQQRLDKAGSDRDTALETIDTRVGAGTTGYLEGQQQKLQVYTQWLEKAKQAQSELLLKAGESTGADQAGILAEADSLQAKIQAMETSLAMLRSEWAQVGAAGMQALGSGLADALTSIATGAESISDAFRSMAQSVLQSIAQVIVKLMLLQAAEAALGGNAAGSWQATALSMFSKGVVGAATGGEIHGPGTGTSDSILLRLSDGEFVQRAAAVRYYGPQFMHALNGLRIPRGVLPGFASGGQVGAATPSTPMMKGDFSHRLAIEPPEGWVVRQLEGPAGARLILKHTATNPKAMRRALGGK